MIEMVLRNRVDFMIIEDAGMNHNLKEMNIDSEMFLHHEKYIYTIDEYLAASKGINPNLVKQLRDAATVLSKNPQND